MKNKIMLCILLLITIFSLVGCNSSYKDCSYNCKWSVYDCPIFENRSCKDNLTYEEVEFICFDRCSGNTLRMVENE